jgi:ATP-dependent DNA helicase RecQ
VLLHVDANSRRHGTRAPVKITNIMGLAEALKRPEQMEVLRVVRQVWGYDTLRPLQDQAIAAGVAQRDSLVVMPTGGGKSLCYQVPPLVADRTDVVVSPLIALMKDQVDGLRASGYPAVALHSNLNEHEIAEAEEGIAAGKFRLIFTAPERLLTGRFIRIIQQQRIKAFAIDEAHCISHWGHDFRRDYRQLSQLKNRFAEVSLHAFTATATQRVRQDIIEQLGLRDPTVLVGSFDRPNLTYRVLPKVEVNAQVREIVDRHRGEASIVYCMSRRETEHLSGYLRGLGYRAAHYHAGLEADERRGTQDAFAREKLDVICATVAFGMGIDRSDVRCVVHTAIPKSIEHFQQETGRAGRDGLPAECVLLYSPRDTARWERLMRESAVEADDPEAVFQAGRGLLRELDLLANQRVCRHKQLVSYFGQDYPDQKCDACDVCLEELPPASDETTLAQKVLSCVARVEQRFGRAHVVDVLLGKKKTQIRSYGHEQLSTYGLLRGMDRNLLLGVIDQLIGQGLLMQSECDRPLLKLTHRALEVMRGELAVELVLPKVQRVTTGAELVSSWEGVDHDLFEHLRSVRRKLAQERGVPPFVIFSDRTLRDMARYRPTSAEALSSVHGVGSKKLRDVGPIFLEAIAAHSAQFGLATDVDGAG